jgi:hypothetical protein
MGSIRPSISPWYPRFTPYTSSPEYIPCRTTARMHAFIPGASPPEHKTAILFIMNHKANAEIAALFGPLLNTKKPKFFIDLKYIEISPGIPVCRL